MTPLKWLHCSHIRDAGNTTMKGTREICKTCRNAKDRERHAAETIQLYTKPGQSEIARSLPPNYGSYELAGPKKRRFG